LQLEGQFCLKLYSLAMPDGTLVRGSVTTDGARIAAVTAESNVPRAGNACIDIGGNILSPGLIDTHIHGACGFDAATTAPHELRTVSIHLAAHGVTGWLPTLAACPPAKLRAALESIRSAQNADGAQILGAHIESGFINPARAGAQPRENIFTPESLPGRQTLALIEEFAAVIKTVTLAPEIEGAAGLIKKLLALGIRVSAGHSDADYDTATAAFKSGVTRVTHLFNAMPPLHQRNPGLAGAALADANVFTEIVCDGAHLHPAVVKTTALAKGFTHAVAITDALNAGAAEGDSFEFAGKTARVEGGCARLEDGTIAGSIITLDQAVRFLADKADIAPAQALAMASLAPAASIGCGDRGAITAGLRADFAVLSENLEVRGVIIGGRLFDRA